MKTEEIETEESETEEGETEKIHSQFVTRKQNILKIQDVYYTNDQSKRIPQRTAQGSLQQCLTNC